MSKVKGPKIGYPDILDHFTLEETKNSDVQDYDPRRPSSSGKCTRELAYALTEYMGKAKYEKEPRDPEVTRLLDLGHYVETSIQNQFKKYVKSEYLRAQYSQQSVDGFEITSKKDPPLNLIVEGSLDDVFITKDSKGLIDYKSKKDKFSRFFKTGWDNIDEMLQSIEGVELIGNSKCAYWVTDVNKFVDSLTEVNEHFFAANFWQLNFYANTRWAKRKGIDHCSIIQINKNDSRLREIRFEPSEKLYSRTREKFQMATDAAAKNKPKDAPRDFNFNSIKCAFCPYSSYCYSEKDKTAKDAFFETFPNKKWPKDTPKMEKELGQSLESLYEQYQKKSKSVKELSTIEDNMLKLMQDNDISKVRFADGRIYIAKFLKSPKPHYELRRAKL